LEGIRKGKGSLVDNIMMGFGHALETFISFLTNSMSYVRLAAFALAHAALGLSAIILGNMIGFLPAFLFLNVLVILIEGMSALIQSMRLTYYEFYTKFYTGGGARYRPFILERA
jgi:V/A-type H+-transporting ATPase subunit I